MPNAHPTPGDGNLPPAQYSSPSERTAFTVASIENGRWLLWAKPDSTWAWRLTPCSERADRISRRARGQVPATRCCAFRRCVMDVSAAHT